ncbi:MAG: hypothetical protein WAW46_03165 [Polaromonas sp.]
MAIMGRTLADPHGQAEISVLAERRKILEKNFYADFDSRLADVRFAAGEQLPTDEMTAVVMSGISPKEHVSLKHWNATVSALPGMQA